MEGGGGGGITKGNASNPLLLRIVVIVISHNVAGIGNSRQQPRQQVIIKKWLNSNLTCGTNI